MLNSHMEAVSVHELEKKEKKVRKFIEENDEVLAEFIFCGGFVIDFLGLG